MKTGERLRSALDEAHGRLGDSETGLQEMIERLQEIARLQGVLHEDITYQAIRKLCECEVLNRSTIVAQTCLRALTPDGGIGTEGADAVRHAVRQLMPEIVHELERHVKQAALLTGRGQVAPLTDVVEFALSRADEEIEAAAA